MNYLFNQRKAKESFEEVKLINRAKLISKEIKNSEKLNRDFGKLYINDGGDKDKLLMVYKNELLEENRMNGLEVGLEYNFFVKERGDFIHLSDWERWDCPSCCQEKIKKLLITCNTRLFILKSIFTKKIEFWKFNQQKLTIELVEGLFKDIVDSLDKDLEEHKKVLELL